jgi:hypothetical protein
MDATMKIQLVTTFLAICLTLQSSGVQADQVPNENQCRQAITAGLEQLRRIPPEINQRDDEARIKLLSDMERMIESNRRQGISECQTWSDMMKKAFNQ